MDSMVWTGTSQLFEGLDSLVARRVCDDSLRSEIAPGDLRGYKWQGGRTRTTLIADTQNPGRMVPCTEYIATSGNTENTLRLSLRLPLSLVAMRPAQRSSRRSSRALRGRYSCAAGLCRLAFTAEHSHGSHTPWKTSQGRDCCR